MRASVMLERRPEYAVILAFDVKVAPEAEKLAAELGVTVFTADIIYHLYDKVTAYMARIKEERRTATADIAVFPVVLDILPNSVFNNKNPLLLGCRVVEGQAKLGTPICVPAKERLYIGRITGLQKNHEDIKEAKKNDEVAVKIEMDKSHTHHAHPAHSSTRADHQEHLSAVAHPLPLACCVAHRVTTSACSVWGVHLRRAACGVRTREQRSDCALSIAPPLWKAKLTRLSLLVCCCVV